MNDLLYNLETIKTLFTKEHKCRILLYKVAKKIINNTQEYCNSPYKLFYICVVSYIAIYFKDRYLLHWAHTSFLKWIDDEILLNGCIRDCWIYDNLDYHVFSLMLVKHCMEALSQSDKRFDYFNYRNTCGSSIKKSIYYLIPYVKKEKIHITNLYPINKVHLPPRVWDSHHCAEVFGMYRNANDTIKNIYLQYFAF
jgi:hypothetical protein